MTGRCETGKQRSLLPPQLRIAKLMIESGEERGEIERWIYHHERTCVHM